MSVCEISKNKTHKYIAPNVSELHRSSLAVGSPWKRGHRWHKVKSDHTLTPLTLRALLALCSLSYIHHRTSYNDGVPKSHRRHCESTQWVPLLLAVVSRMGRMLRDRRDRSTPNSSLCLRLHSCFLPPTSARVPSDLSRDNMAKKLLQPRPHQRSRFFVCPWLVGAIGVCT